MSRSTYDSLLEDLRRNDMKSFRTTIEIDGLPQDDNYYDYDLLMRALRSNRKRMVNYLLAKKCRVNKPLRLSTNVNTPLHLAAGKLGWSSIVEKMLELKARVTDVNADGNTPLHLAFINRPSNKVINLLLHHYQWDLTKDICNKDELGFMHIACMKAGSKSVKGFFNFGFGMSDIHSQVLWFSDSIYAGYAPLHFAVEAGNHEVADFLCQNEADVYAFDRNFSTPLHLALEKRDIQMIDILFHYDSNYGNYVNEFGATHFMAACAGSDSTIVEKYIRVIEKARWEWARQVLGNRVKDIPGRQFAGYTALHFACEYGRCQAVYELLVRGDHLSLTTEKLSPLDLAQKNDHKAVCDLLQRHCSICESCNDLVKTNAKSETIVEIMKPTDENKCVGDGMSGKCFTVEKMIKGNTVFGLSRDRIIFFAITIAVVDLPWFLQKLTVKLIDFIMGPKKDCAFCEYFNCHPSKPRPVKVKLAGPFGDLYK